MSAFSSNAMSVTENGAAAFSTTSCATMDLFVKAVRKCPDSVVGALMGPCWNEGATRLLQLICQTRDPRGCGKGERDVSYAMLCWLKQNKPKTYAMNIAKIASDYGRYDDLLEIAQRFINNNSLELQILAHQLQVDITSENPSLAAKWAPSEKGYYNDLVRPLAGFLFPGDREAKKKYRKEILAPLRARLNVVETKMCSGCWNDINYEHVPSQAMLLYGRQTSKSRKRDLDESQAGAFLRHDQERFKSFRELVKVGEAKINTTGLQPHQLVKGYMHGVDSVDDTVELQWQTMMDKLLSGGGSLGSSMCVVDVSGSMHGEPMEVAIALGLMASALSEAPFKNTVITFHERPSLFHVTKNTLMEKVHELKTAPWGGSTNFEATLDLVLNMAVTFKVPPSNMVKTLFVFTDMQFNFATRTPEETIYRVCKAKYAKAGYPFPNIVFWNLRASNHDAFPVQVSQCGTAMVSGFSSDLLRVFMSGVEFSPLNILSDLLKKYDVSVDPSEAYL